MPPAVSNWIHRKITKWLIIYINSSTTRLTTWSWWRKLHTEAATKRFLSIIKLSEINVHIKIWTRVVWEVAEPNSPATHILHWNALNWIKWTKHEITHVQNNILTTEQASNYMKSYCNFELFFSKENWRKLQNRKIFSKPFLALFYFFGEQKPLVTTDFYCYCNA